MATLSLWLITVFSYTSAGAIWKGFHLQCYLDFQVSFSRIAVYKTKDRPISSVLNAILSKYCFFLEVECFDKGVVEMHNMRFHKIFDQRFFIGIYWVLLDFDLRFLLQSIIYCVLFIYNISYDFSFLLKWSPYFCLSMPRHCIEKFAKKSQIWDEKKNTLKSSTKIAQITQ